jgi:hypothetical protein
MDDSELGNSGEQGHYIPFYFTFTPESLRFFDVLRGAQMTAPMILTMLGRAGKTGNGGPTQEPWKGGQAPGNELLLQPAQDGSECYGHSRVLELSLFHGLGPSINNRYLFQSVAVSHGFDSDRFAGRRQVNLTPTGSCPATLFAVLHSLWTACLLFRFGHILEFRSMSSTHSSLAGLYADADSGTHYSVFVLFSLLLPCWPGSRCDLG